MLNDGRRSRVDMHDDPIITGTSTVLRTGIQGIKMYREELRGVVRVFLYHTSTVLVPVPYSYGVYTAG